MNTVDVKKIMVFLFHSFSQCVGGGLITFHILGVGMFSNTLPLDLHAYVCNNGKPCGQDPHPWI